MRNIFLIIVLAIILTGCESIKKLEIFTTSAPVEILHPALPEQLQLTEPVWTNLNKEIITQMLNDQELTEDDFVFVTLTPKGYEVLSLGMKDLYKQIAHQKEIIIYYRQITEELEDLR